MEQLHSQFTVPPSASSSSSSFTTHNAPPPEQPPSSTDHNNSIPHLFTPNNSSSSTKKRRRLDTEEKRILTEIFYENPKPNSAVRSQLAQRLDMTPRGIQIWFQNQRSKLKRDEKTLATADEEKEEDSTSSSSREVMVSDGDLIQDSGETTLLSCPSEGEASNSTQSNFIMPPPTTTDETREQQTVNEPPRPDRTNVEPPPDNEGGGNQPKPHKKQRRRRLNPEETDALLEFFEQTEKPDSAFRHEIAARLNLPPQLIGIWFQNQRAKRKRLTALSGPHTPIEEDVPPIVGVEKEVVHREVAVNTNVNPKCAEQVATSSLYTHDALNPQTKSPSNDNSAVVPYADQTGVPCQSASRSNNVVAAPGIPQKPQKLKSANTTRRSSRASSTFSSSLEEEGRHPQQRRRMTKEEICILSAVFARTRMPTIDTREELAIQFDRTPRSIQIWFQNQRSKLKRGLVTLESYRRIGEGIMRRDVDNSMDAVGEGDGNELDGEWEV